MAGIVRNFEQTHGYPPGENVVRTAAPGDSSALPGGTSVAGLHDDLAAFYSRVEEVSLPDVGNGFFVHPLEDVVAGRVEGFQPTGLRGSVNDAITVFGSDGGGGLFALNESGDRVYRLSGGSLVASVYEVDDSGVAVVATDLWAFLDHLLDEVRAAAR
ncbi:PqqD family protein [Couchioplanes azureus]|uniref:PqqD family protein n=1 Tax=Couchioplanes caeruleus TaxID=56438 RepID=UPI00167178D1|nr:PqqD family protein [Couchioplanes caeruleus]